MVYKSESNIFVSIQLKIVLSRGIKSRWNTRAETGLFLLWRIALDQLKFPTCYTQLFCPLANMNASRTLLYSLWFARWQGHYVHATHSLFYHAYDADIFSLVANKVMVNRCNRVNFSLKLENTERKINYFEENENFTTTVIMCVRSAIKAHRSGIAV